jgi:hypothetical protein
MADTVLQDPKGRQIVLLDNTWFGHIVKAHPDMANRRRDVEQAVRQPDAIHLSKSSADCRVYYSLPAARGIMVTVVADLPKQIVLTAYRSRRRKGNPE